MIKRKTSNSGQQRRGSQGGRGRNENMESMENNPLHEAFLDELADLYNAEQQLTKALPKMAKAAKHEELREAFESHLQETEQQVERLKEAFEALGEPAKGKTCKAMEGLIKEAKEMMEEFKDSPALDAVLISAAQKVEHYEIASYGTVCTWAEQMGHTEALELLRANMDEEEAADEKLTGIAESVCNIEAEQAHSEKD
jgi:ferritin-like metal-binding protein YciE